MQKVIACLTDVNVEGKIYIENKSCYLMLHDTVTGYSVKIQLTLKHIGTLHRALQVAFCFALGSPIVESAKRKNTNRKGT